MPPSGAVPPPQASSPRPSHASAGPGRAGRVPGGAAGPGGGAALAAGGAPAGPAGPRPGVWALPPSRTNLMAARAAWGGRFRRLGSQFGLGYGWKQREGKGGSGPPHQDGSGGQIPPYLWVSDFRNSALLGCLSPPKPSRAPGCWSTMGCPAQLCLLLNGVKLPEIAYRGPNFFYHYRSISMCVCIPNVKG